MTSFCAGAAAGGFHFQVNDGVNFAPRQIFSTTAHSLVLTLQRNNPIEVYPGTTANSGTIQHLGSNPLQPQLTPGLLPLCLFKGSVTPITEQELQVVTDDVSDIRRNHSVVFAVTAPPKLGRLLRRMPDNSTQNISTFTQSMVGGLPC